MLELPFRPRTGFDYHAYARSKPGASFPPGSGTAIAEDDGCLWTSRVTDLSWAAQELLLTGWDFAVREPQGLREDKSLDRWMGWVYCIFRECASA